MDMCDRAGNMLFNAEAPEKLQDIVVSDPGRHPAIYATARQKFRELDAKSKAGYVDVKQPYPRRLEIASDAFDQNAAAQQTSGDTLTWTYNEMSKPQ